MANVDDTDTRPGINRNLCGKQQNALRAWAANLSLSLSIHHPSDYTSYNSDTNMLDIFTINSNATPPISEKQKKLYIKE